MKFTEFILDKMKLESTPDTTHECLDAENSEKGSNKKSIVRFFFPVPSIIILLLFFIIALLTLKPQDVLSTVFAFFIIFVLPLDCAIWVMRSAIRRIKDFVNNRAQTASSNAGNTVTAERNQANATQEMNHKSHNYQKGKYSKEYIDTYSDMCAAHCEFDESQNFSSNELDGNFRFKDERFYNVTDDDFTKKLVTAESLSEIKKLIIDTYNIFGIRIVIEGVNFTRAYAIFHIVPYSGVRLYKVLGLEREISAALKAPVFINAIYDKGYVGLVIPIGYLLNNPYCSDKHE